MTNTYAKPKLSVKTQTLATIVAIVAAVVLPQLFHLMGAVSGLGTALGETFLPMHLPIILAGLLAGPYVGAIAGVLSPLISFALTGMPTAAMLPFMMIELFVYGLTSGLLRNAPNCPLSASACGEPMATGCCGCISQSVSAICKASSRSWVERKIVFCVSRLRR